MPARRFANPIPIKLSVRSVFSRYALTPARGLNFGPMEYNTVAKPRIFEITNLGEFPMDYSLTSLHSSGAPPAGGAPAKPASAKPASAKGKPKGAAAVSKSQLESVSINLMCICGRLVRFILSVQF